MKSTLVTAFALTLLAASVSAQEKVLLFGVRAERRMNLETYGINEIIKPFGMGRVSSTALASFNETQPLQFAQRATSFREAKALVRQVDEARSALALHRTSAPRASTIDFAQRLVSGLGQPSDLHSDS